MTKTSIQQIHTSGAPSPSVPISQGVRFGSLLFVSGQVPVSAGTGTFVGGDIRTQTQQVFENIKAILEAGDSCLARVLKVTAFLTDIGDFAGFNEIYTIYFSKYLPARSTFQVARLGGPYAVEVEVIAATDG